MTDTILGLHTGSAHLWQTIPKTDSAHVINIVTKTEGGKAIDKE